MAQSSPPAGPAEHRLTALVPMRHHSERVPDKNFRPLNGRPLYTYILDTLIAADSIGQIVVDTDSPVIKEGIAKNYSAVVVLDRPAELTAPEISMYDIILWDLSQVGGKHFLQTHSTNPLLRPETVDLAVEAYFGGLPKHDSLFGVTRFQKRLWTPEGKPVNHEPDHLIQTQHLPLLYEENSCLYIFQRQQMLARRNRIGASPLMFEIPIDEAWDIDESLDLEIVSALQAQRLQSGRRSD
jgi:CMP-N-acetylneuraminic acid synthetase